VVCLRIAVIISVEPHAGNPLIKKQSSTLIDMDFEEGSGAEALEQGDRLGVEGADTA